MNVLSFIIFVIRALYPCLAEKQSLPSSKVISPARICPCSHSVTRISQDSFMLQVPCCPKGLLTVSFCADIVRRNLGMRGRSVCRGEHDGSWLPLRLARSRKHGEESRSCSHFVAYLRGT